MCKLKISKGELIQINACRMYSQIAYLSNITSEEMKCILPNFITGPRPQYLHSSYRWSILPSSITSAEKN